MIYGIKNRLNFKNYPEYYDPFFSENPQNRHYLLDESTRFNRKANPCKGS